MRTRSLGKTGLDVSELCMGCWEIGHGEGLPAAEEQIAKWKEEEGIRFLSAERYAYEAPVGHDVYTAFQHYVDGELFEDTRKAFRREDGWREQLLRVGESWGDDGHSFFLYFDQATGGRSFPTLNREQRAWRSIATEAATTTGWRGWTTRVGIRRRRRPSSCSTSSRAT